jgi:hypothetical protein
MDRAQETAHTPQWTIRASIPEDVHFLYSTWLNDVWSKQRGAGLRKTLFFKEYPKVLDRLLARDDVRVSIATPLDEPIVILGYIVFDQQAIYYSFVKSLFRKCGIGTSLYNHAKQGTAHA